MAGENARQQPRRGAGVAEVEHVVRLAAAADAEAAHPPQPGAHVLDHGAQRPQGGGGGQHVLALQQAADVGLAQRQGAEHQGAVRHRFVAGRTDPAVQSGDGAGDQLGRCGSRGQGTLHEGWRKCGAAPS